MAARDRDLTQASVRRLRCAAAGAGFLAILAGPAGAVTTYNVLIDTSPWTGLKTRVVFNLTSSNQFFNVANILNFTHDGRVGQLETEGGLVTGDLVEGFNPAYASSISDYGPQGESYFFTELAVPFDSLGKLITFTVDLTEFTFGETQLFDEFAFFIVGEFYDQHPFPTADPLGANALFSICINGLPGGDLGVFSPMQFVPPDSLKLLVPSVSAPVPSPPGGRLRFRAVTPNPSAGTVRFEIEVPNPGGPVSLRVYDIAGRVVSQLFDGPRPAGLWTASWAGTGRDGRRLPAGVYLARVDLGGQSAIRKVVLSR